MSDGSSIEWTDATWNPIRGCMKISPGCKHCYAERFAERFRGVPGHPFEQGFDLRLVPEKLNDPLRWKRGRRIFVNSMSDLFLAEVPEEYILRVADVMKRADWHIFQILTKRADRMRDLLRTSLRDVATLPHIWWGTSVEDRKHGLPRIAQLQDAPAAMRFLSVEPLLEDLGTVDLTGIDWIIVGGESGPRARPMQREWVVSLLEQCRAANVPFFFKQWGGVQKGKHGRELDGRTYDELPVQALRFLGAGGHAMSNQNNRGGDDAASSNTPAEPERKHKGGGNMGAGKSGGKSFGAEKPEVRDDNGSREAGRDWD